MVSVFVSVSSAVPPAVCDRKLHYGFYCHQAKLVVELDGSQHTTPEEMEYDQKRTDYLESLGLKVLRFSNLDVMRKFRNVCEVIDMEAKSRTANNF